MFASFFGQAVLMFASSYFGICLMFDCSEISILRRSTQRSLFSNTSAESLSVIEISNVLLTHCNRRSSLPILKLLRLEASGTSAWSPSNRSGHSANVPFRESSFRGGTASRSLTGCSTSSLFGIWKISYFL